MFNISSIIKQGKSSLDKLYQKQTTIKAGSEVLKIYHYFLNRLNLITKGVKAGIPSPFDLFTGSLSSTNSFKLTPFFSSKLIEKISQIGHQKNPTHPLREFIESLSLQSKNTKSVSVQNAGEKANLVSQFSSEIIETISEKNGFKTLRLKRPLDWNFLPGQYLEIRSENSRATKPAILAIASSVDDEYIEITAKSSNDPLHSNYCLNEVVGDYLTITGPLGSNFPLDLVTPHTPLLVLGGGTGLTALKSILESIPQGTEAKLIYSNKTTQDLLYHEKIEKWKSEGHIISLTQEKSEGYAEGRITDHLKHEQLNSGTLVFICGPKDLVIETAQLLVQLGVPLESIYGSLPATAKEGGPVYRADHPKMLG